MNQLSLNEFWWQQRGAMLLLTGAIVFLMLIMMMTMCADNHEFGLVGPNNLLPLI